MTSVRNVAGLAERTSPRLTHVSRTASMELRTRTGREPSSKYVQSPYCSAHSQNFLARPPAATMSGMTPTHGHPEGPGGNGPFGCFFFLLARYSIVMSNVRMPQANVLRSILDGIKIPIVCLQMSSL